MSKELIVLISEGAKTEKEILESIEKVFYKKYDSNKEFIFLSFKTHIYTLYNVLKADDFLTNTIEILRERHEDAKELLEGLEVEDISAVYLFFDYDGHACQTADRDARIKEMIETFDNETELGKMYISYPMVEAIKDLKHNDCCTRRCTFPIAQGSDYKNQVAQITTFNNFDHYNEKKWNYIAEMNICKASCLSEGTYQFPKYEDVISIIDQANVFESQKKKYIDVNNEVAVLSSFPLFIVEYYGEKVYDDFLKSHETRSIEFDNLCCNRKED